MHHELQARERQGMEQYIKNLETTVELITNWFNAMHSDFANCAKENILPCNYCTNNKTCNGNQNDCNFNWNNHN